jgi:hypothetical protein
LKKFLSISYGYVFIKRFFVQANEAFRKFSRIFRMEITFDKAVVDVAEVGGFEVRHYLVG